MTAASVGKVLVVGGGVGGMAAAIRMREAGIAVDLIDLDAKWGVYGTGVSLSTLTLRALSDLGLSKEIMVEGNCYDTVILYSKDGHVLQKMTSPRLYAPDVPAEGGILRPALHAIMKRKVLEAGTAVRTGVTIEALEDNGTSVQVSFTDGTQGEYDLVVGADGLFSKVRDMIFPDAPKPRFTGQACWRALFDIPQGWDCGHMYLGERVKVGFTLCSPDKMYMYLLEHVPGNPRRKQEELPGLLRGLLEGFGDVPGVLRETISAETPIIYRPLDCILLTDAWSKGRVTLLGDAVHATTPHLASGAGAAVEDAIVLTEELVSSASVEQALENYYRRRIPRASLVVNNSLKLGELEMAGRPMQEQAALIGASMKAIAEPYR
ncbi:MAG TPA: FAD-dependent monooxygenase [Ensifer sp.]|nr:FAD-dependent monooxygenase [Ensifer sp.]